MRTGRVLVLAGVLSLSSAASAESLVNRVADAVDTWSTGALLEAYGSSRPLMIKGTDISKSVVKAGRIIKWGGLIGLTAGLVNDSLNWYYSQAQQSASPVLDGWWKSDGRFYDLKPLDLQGFRYNPSEIVCQGSQGSRPLRAGLAYSAPAGDYAAIYIWAPDGQPVQNAAFKGSYGDSKNYLLNNICKNLTPEASLSTVAAGSASVMPALRQIVADYLRAHPEIAYSNVAPTPNRNQKDDAVTDPGLDTDGDGQTDGDEVRTIPTNSGNRPHPGDGAPSDPNEASDKSPDTDGDGIPDWRDGDDDDDGTPDNDEPTQPPDCQKDRQCNPETERDTDGDGIPDRLDDDDDNDGWPDDVEEREGSDPKNPNDKPTDKPCSEGSVRGPSGSCEPKPPEPCKEGEVAGPSGSCEPKPPEPCKAGEVRNADGKCEPEKDEPKCPEGKKLDDSEPPKCVDDLDPKDPVNDDCGTFGIKRLLTHTGHYLRDVVFPCEDDYGWIDEIRQAASTKFPFSLTGSLDNMVSYSGSTDQSAALPSKIGPFELNWSWLAPLVLVTGLLFKGFIGWLAVDIILSRLSGQVVIK